MIRTDPAGCCAVKIDRDFALIARPTKTDKTKATTAAIGEAFSYSIRA